jgi:hypothetical protein
VEGSVHPMTWTVTIVLIFIVFCVTAWAMDRSHRKNLENHQKEIDRIYRKYER